LIGPVIIKSGAVQKSNIENCRYSAVYRIRSKVKEGKDVCENLVRAAEHSEEMLLLGNIARRVWTFRQCTSPSLNFEGGNFAAVVLKLCWKL
jgi:hypothetical protein